MLQQQQQQQVLCFTLCLLLNRYIRVEMGLIESGNLKLLLNSLIVLVGTFIEEKKEYKRI